MTKQEKNPRGKQHWRIVKSGRQLILMHDDGTEQPIEEIAKKDDVLHLGTTMRVIEMDKSGLDSDPADDDPYANEFHYKSWWNQFRGPWLQSDKMTEDEIRTRADDAWECGDYKEMINLMENRYSYPNYKRFNRCSVEIWRGNIWVYLSSIGICL